MGLLLALQSGLIPGGAQGDVMGYQRSNPVVKGKANNYLPAVLTLYGTVSTTGTQICADTPYRASVCQEQGAFLCPYPPSLPVSPFSAALLVSEAGPHDFLLSVSLTVYRAIHSTAGGCLACLQLGLCGWRLGTANICGCVPESEYSPQHGDEGMLALSRIDNSFGGMC